MDDKAIKVFNMFNLLRKIDGLNKERLKKYGLNNLETLILLNLYKNDNLTQKDLVVMFKAPKQTVNTIVLSLKDKGYLATSSVETDKRAKSLTLTQEGRKEAERIASPIREKNLAIFDKLGEEKIGDIVANLNDLAYALEENLRKE